MYLTLCVFMRGTGEALGDPRGTLNLILRILIKDTSHAPPGGAPEEPIFHY